MVKNSVKKFLSAVLVIAICFSIYVLLLGNNLNYYLLIYNSEQVTEEDVKYINDYAKTIPGKVKFIDAKGVKSGASMCSALKNSYQSISNNIKGIQIFGTKEQVPTFNIGYEINMGENIDRAYDDFVTDFFYSNFDSDMNRFNGCLGINTIIANDLKVSFKPKWLVARLPLAKGQIAPFIKKYFNYIGQAKAKENIPIVSFSNPILGELPIVDDMGYFIRQKIDKEYGYLKRNQYKIYGLQEGYYKVRNEVDGDFTKENVEKENINGIMHLVINCHGEKDKFIKTVFANENMGSQKMTLFMDRSNINSILKHNYYTLTAWSCLVAENLDDQNIVYDMLRYKCVGAIAPTTIISNNGTNNMDSFEKSKRNNFYCFFYEFFHSLSSGCSYSQSFYNAQKVYADAVWAHKYMELAQYHILNLIGYQYLGLI